MPLGRHSFSLSNQPVSVMNLPANWPHHNREYQARKKKGVGRIKGLVDRVTNLKFPPGVYILLYHSIYNPKSHHPWEVAYRKVSTEISNFESQIQLFSDNAEFIRLSSIPDLFRNQLTKPYFSVTFDDAYTTVLPNAAEFLEQRRIAPTVFVNSDFCFNGKVYYRALEALLRSRGHGQDLKNAYRQTYGSLFDSEHTPRRLSKTHYQYTVTERVVLDVWNRHIGHNMPKNIHMQRSDLIYLKNAGWECGVHTKSHPSLAALTLGQQDSEIKGCYRAMKQQGLNPIRFLSYPHGDYRFLNQHTYTWISEHKSWNACFALGGVNFSPNRTEWLRIPAGDVSLPDFTAQLKNDIRLSRD